MIGTALVLGLLTAGFVGGYRQLALRRGWLDTPNARSSHRNSVPRGAGVVIVALTFVAAAILPGPTGLVSTLLPGLGIAAIGWWDDLRGVSARLRFVAYGGCAALALVLVWMQPGQGADIPLPWLWLVAGTLGLLWSINLYNFMDGINGIAALEAIFVLGACLLLSPHSQLQPLLASTIAIAAGFLCWNFPVGRVFMGDVGSAFLGFLLGLLAVHSYLQGDLGWATWGILGALFIADTGYTLLVRIATGQRWHEAHRSHAYQKLNQRWHSHAKVVTAAMAVNLFWLLPLAWVVHQGKLSPAPALLLAYLPLLGACRLLGAGIPEGTKV